MDEEGLVAGHDPRWADQLPGRAAVEGAARREHVVGVVAPGLKAWEDTGSQSLAWSLVESRPAFETEGAASIAAITTTPATTRAHPLRLKATATEILLKFWNNAATRTLASPRRVASLLRGFLGLLDPSHE